MVKIAYRLSDYYRAAPLPHLVLCICIGMVITLSLLAFEYHASGHHEGLIIAILISCSWITGAFFSIADIISRYREHLRIKRILLQKGFNEKIFKAVAASRCQRDAALSAAHKLGYGDSVKRLYHNLGYRWYHLLPDIIIANPLKIFSPHFLKTAFKPGKKI